MRESGLEKRSGVFARIKSAYEKITCRHELVSKKNHVVNAYLYCMEPGVRVSRRNHVVNAFIYPELLKED